MIYRVQGDLTGAIGGADFSTIGLYCVFISCHEHKKYIGLTHHWNLSSQVCPTLSRLLLCVCLPLFVSNTHFLPSPLLTSLSPPSSTMLPANLLLLMVLLLPQASSGRQGGDTSKTDHGRGSPVPSSLLSPPASSPLKPSLAQTIQSLLLSRLGLQSQPDPGPGVPVPRYILDLYRFHQQQYHLVEDPLFSFPTQHIQQANTVRSFHHNGKITDTWKKQLTLAVDLFYPW